MKPHTMPKRNLGRVAAGAAVAASIGSLGLAAQAASADTIHASGSNETVSITNYKAVFSHTSSEGETLKVYDYATDGQPAVAYVKMSLSRYPSPPKLIDKDRLVVSNGYHNFNLREGDSGSYDVPEGHLVSIMICKGYASNPGDNCSDWETGIA